MEDESGWWMDQGLSGFRIDAIMEYKERSDMGVISETRDGPDGDFTSDCILRSQENVERNRRIFDGR